MTADFAPRCRPLGADDWAAFQALRLAAIADSPSALYPTHEEEAGQRPEAVQERIAETRFQVVFGIFDGATLVGMAGLRQLALVQVAHKAMLWGVFVHPDQRGGGLARQLLSALFSHARERGIDQITLSVNAENPRAAGLYRSMGFEVYGREPRAMRIGERFYDEDLMVLRLDR